MATAGGADAESYAVELALPSFSAFYEQHNPKHGRLAKRLLQMHAGNEEKLFDGLVTKYGDAAVTDLVTGISQAAEKAAGARLPSPSGTKDTVASRGAAVMERVRGLSHPAHPCPRSQILPQPPTRRRSCSPKRHC